MSTGVAKFYFKGINLRQEKGKVVSSKSNIITVMQDSDKTLLSFVNIEGRWLLENHTSSKSLLYGTEFIFNK